MSFIDGDNLYKLCCRLGDHPLHVLQSVGILRNCDLGHRKFYVGFLRFTQFPMRRIFGKATIAKWLAITTLVE